MKFVVGLGNPGEKFSNNRHNLGYMLVNKIAQDKRWNSKRSSKAEICKVEAGKQSVMLVKPLTFMNDSGYSVASIVRAESGLKLSDVYVVHDDLDIKLGEYKVHFGKGPRDHNGVNSVEKYLKSKDFWRVRMGAENRELISRVSGEDYVLSDFSKEELVVVDNLIPKVIKDLLDRIR